jgi:hypothetical protein
MVGRTLIDDNILFYRGYDDPPIKPDTIYEILCSASFSSLNGYKSLVNASMPNSVI